MPCVIGLGPPEVIIVLVIVLLLFGGKKIPELFRGLGEGVKEFKRGTEEGLGSSEGDPSSVQETAASSAPADNRD